MKLRSLSLFQEKSELTFDPSPTGYPREPGRRSSSPPLSHRLWLDAVWWTPPARAWDLLTHDPGSSTEEVRGSFRTLTCSSNEMTLGWIFSRVKWHTAFAVPSGRFGRCEQKSVNSCLDMTRLTFSLTTVQVCEIEALISLNNVNRAIPYKTI